MVNVPFLAQTAEKTKPISVRGRYNKATQMLVQEKSGRGAILATQPTHVETATGGHNDTDTGTNED